MLTVVVLALAAVAFFFALRPLFGEPRPIPQDRPEGDIRNAVEKSLQELRTDLQLQKIQEEDLKAIEGYLEASSRES